MDVAIVICTWNRAQRLAETLASLAAVAPPPETDVRVLVVDNNSTDGTREVIERAAASWPLGSLLGLFEPRQGKQFALNRAVAHTAADLVVFTDDDVAFRADWLTSIVRVARESDADVIGGLTRARWPGVRPAWYHPAMSAVVAEVDLGPQPLDPAPEDYAPAGTNLVVTRRALRVLGGFSERYYRHMDYEFGVRARRQGLRLRYDPSIVVETPVAETVISKQYFRRWYFKLGVAEAIHFGEPSRPFGPPWVWRQLAEQLLASLVATVRLRPSVAFLRHVTAVQRAGYLACVAHQRLAPGRHAQWVERWSQKKADRFA